MLWVCKNEYNFFYKYFYYFSTGSYSKTIGLYSEVDGGLLGVISGHTGGITQVLTVCLPVPVRVIFTILGKRWNSAKMVSTCSPGQGRTARFYAGISGTQETSSFGSSG